MFSISEPALHDVEVTSRVSACSCLLVHVAADLYGWHGFYARLRLRTRAQRMVPQYYSLY